MYLLHLSICLALCTISLSVFAKTYGKHTIHRTIHSRSKTRNMELSHDHHKTGSRSYPCSSNQITWEIRSGTHTWPTWSLMTYLELSHVEVNALRHHPVLGQVFPCYHADHLQVETEILLHCKSRMSTSCNLICSVKVYENSCLSFCLIRKIMSWKVSKA